MYVLQHFDFGESIVMPEAELSTLLSSLFQTLSATHPTFLILHAPTADLEALQLLGIDTDTFHRDLSAPGFQPQPGQVYVCDTQSLYSGWSGDRRKEKLMTACKALGVDTTGARPHNAGQFAEVRVWRREC